MLLCTPRRCRALNLPIFLGSFSFFILLVGVLVLLETGELWGFGSVGLGLIALAVAVGNLRRIDVEGEDLRVWTPYVTKTLPIAELVLAISMVRGSRGGSTYTVYALAGGEQIDLAEKWSLRGAERLIERLTETFLRGRARSDAVLKNHAEAEEREARWRSTDA